MYEPGRGELNFVQYSCQKDNVWSFLRVRYYKEHHIASFISKVVHDLFSFRREVLANGPRLRQVFFLICYNVRAETTTRCPSGINIVQN